MSHDGEITTVTERLRVSDAIEVYGMLVGIAFVKGNAMFDAVGLKVAKSFNEPVGLEGPENNEPDMATSCSCIEAVRYMPDASTLPEVEEFADGMGTGLCRRLLYTELSKSTRNLRILA
jgi:hypothetical protein